MHEDLLRRALESGKTVSRKARSKQSSSAASRIGTGSNSKNVSRVASTNVSDDEDGSVLEGDDSSTDLFDTEDILESNWQEEFSTRTSRILDRSRKKGSPNERDEDLSFYVAVLRLRYVRDQISWRLPELYAGFVKYLRADGTERETLLAIEAIAVTTITDPETLEGGQAYDICNKPLQDLIYESESIAVKENAIQALALVSFFSGSDVVAVEDEVMPLFVSIAESDGSQISADDSPEVVIAALRSWSLLATLLDDAQEAGSQMIEAAVDQLSSTETMVQISAGETIALIYEKSYTDLESDEELSDEEEEQAYAKQDRNMGMKLARNMDSTRMVERYQPFRRKDELLSTLTELSRVSTKSRRKQDRKELHATFSDVYQSVINPTLGPRYSQALDPGTMKAYGSRMKVKLDKDSTMIINKWWKLVRLQVLRKWLRVGFLQHHRANDVVLEMLPVLTTR